MGMTGLLDTNVALYLLGGQLAKPLPTGTYGVSVITEMELLAWPSLTSEEEKKVREFLGRLVICELTPSVRARAVQLRREQHLSCRMRSYARLRWNSALSFGRTMPV